MNPQLELAIAIARNVHFGTYRRGNGEPYFSHVEKVARLVEPLGYVAQAKAYLHDSIEDTDDREHPVTRHVLVAVGIDPVIAAGVSNLSRRPGESYSDFVARIAREGADDDLQVKLADLHHNMLPGPGGIRDQTRYFRADSMLRAELIRRGVDPLVFHGVTT